MRLECYENEELQAKIAEYESVIGHPFRTDGFDNEPTENIFRYLDHLISFKIDASRGLSDEDIRWLNKVDEYRAHFGVGFSMGFGAPKSMERCYEIMCDCIEHGEPFDAYAFAGIDESRRPYIDF
ncbi:MAG: hypothetical protein IKE22_04990 [Atopobiaceae bacterium]|nr:hypothetical protein [Atopobiaceae bacterium]